ncbi:MAG: hypothetical protein MI922_02775 [Bacteroidales bacterium]|nr:hypothetical protein [Bacteroidales bacterium]
MDLIKHIERYKHIDYLIRLKKTGNPLEFAEKIGLSRRQLFYYLDELRDFGLNIKYSNLLKTYYYEDSGIYLHIDVFIDDIKNIVQ